MNNRYLEQVISNILSIADIKDYCPNGLQVEGRKEIQSIISGVTANQALLDIAVEKSADAVLVHHGYFWKNSSPVIIDMQRHRLKTLLSHDINLYAYHLPLDIHPKLGNNVQLARLLGIEIQGTYSKCQPTGIVLYGNLSVPLPGHLLAELLQQRLQRYPFYCSTNAISIIHKVAWCTGAGQNYLLAAAREGIHAFITGEVSEATVHIAREMGIHFYAIGHHASERYGIQALGKWLSVQHGLSVKFIDIDNPI